jgi:seryl-tRNA synthetase
MENILAIERELADLKAKQAAADEQHKTIFQRLDKQDKMIESVRMLATSVEKLAMKQDTMETKLGDLCTDVDEIKSKPAKRWEGMVEKAIFTVVGAFVAYVLARLGIV